MKNKPDSKLGKNAEQSEMQGFSEALRASVMDLGIKLKYCLGELVLNQLILDPIKGLFYGERGREDAYNSVSLENTACATKYTERKDLGSHKKAPSASLVGSRGEGGGSQQTR